MQDQLIQIRERLNAALVAVDQLISGLPTESGIDLAIYRIKPGGPLSEIGVAEIYRRFEIGQPDSLIAKEMGISVQGSHARRLIWLGSKV